MDPVMGVMAAFIFASQMINFPLLGAAASGHLIGSALAEILFGFWPAFIMTTVITIKAFIFQDGGISVLGVNILNMAIIAPALAVLIKKIARIVHLPIFLTAFLSGWVSVVGISFMGALELALSGVVPFF